VITQHLKVMKDMVELGNRNLFRGFGQLRLTDEGSKLMEQIRGALSSMEKEQRARLAQQQAKLAAKTDHVALISFAGSALAGVLVLACAMATFGAVHRRRKADEKLDRLLGSMPDGLFIVNAEGKIVSSNAQAEKLFGYSEPQATKLMMQVHNEGKAVVSAGSRESMEVDVSKLHAAGLWATMQQDR